MKNSVQAGLALAATMTILMAVAGPAHAFGVQSDNMLVGVPASGQQAFLAKAHQLRAGWIRVMVVQSRWEAGERASFINAAKAAHDAGFSVDVTLMSWQRDARGREDRGAPEPTAARWQRFTTQVVAAMAPYVDAWSPMNEPNHPAFNPKATISCRPGGGSRGESVLSIKSGRAQVLTYHRVKAGRGAYARTSSGFRRAGHGDYRRTRSVRSVTARSTVRVVGKAALDACHQQAWAAAYRRIYDDSARIIRRGDRGALMIAGELAPNVHNDDFFTTFLRAGRGRPHADVVSSHPYAFVKPSTRQDTHGAWKLTSIEHWVKDVHHWIPGAQAWATEWGYKADRPNKPSWWTQAISRFKRAKVRNVFLFGIVQSHGRSAWDSAIVNADLSNRPAFAAIKSM